MGFVLHGLSWFFISLWRSWYYFSVTVPVGLLKTSGFRPINHCIPVNCPISFTSFSTGFLFFIDIYIDFYLLGYLYTCLKLLLIFIPTLLNIFSFCGYPYWILIQLCSSSPTSILYQLLDLSSMKAKNKKNKSKSTRRQINCTSAGKSPSTPVSPEISNPNPCKDYHRSDHWIDCDTCGQWWHSNCISLDKEVCKLIVKHRDKFSCPICIVSKLNLSVIIEHNSPSSDLLDKTPKNKSAFDQDNCTPNVNNFFPNTPVLPRIPDHNTSFILNDSHITKQLINTPVLNYKDKCTDKCSLLSNSSKEIADQSINNIIPNKDPTPRNQSHNS